MASEKHSHACYHDQDCAYVANYKDTCTCYLSWNQEVLAKTSVFQAATAYDPTSESEVIDEQDQEALNGFIAEKKSQQAGRKSQHTTSLPVYHPLMDGEIRILELHPAKPGSPLRGELHVVSVDFVYPSRPVFTKTRVTYYKNGTTRRRHTNHAVVLATGTPMWYTALSYVWGPPIFDQIICLKDGDIKITSSLARALHHLRMAEKSIFLWIDQVCINQPDRLEKEQQIPLMGKIYTHATNTVIWLGDGQGSDPIRAFETMELAYSRLQMSDGDITPDDFGRLFFPPTLDRSWWEVRQFLRTVWFSRLWTIQEAVLSKKLYIKWGKAEADWEDVAAWCYQLQESGILEWLVQNDALDKAHSTTPIKDLRPPSAGSVINSLQSDRLEFMTIGPTHFLGALVSTRYAEAWNPKDKIYGILGIASADIRPNYSEEVTARDVYHQVCLSMLDTSLHEILSCVDHDTPLQPSWVPDWSAARVTATLGYFTKVRALYYAGGKLEHKKEFYNKLQYKVDISEDKKCLILSGKIVDKIVALGCVSNDPILDIDEPREKNKEWASYIKLITSRDLNQPYPKQGTSIYDAFWQTLLSGRDGSGAASPSAEHGEVFSLILDSTTGTMPSLPGQTYSPRRLKGYFTLDSLKTRRPARILEDFRIAFRAAAKMRRFAVTERGYFALVPRGVREGDAIVVFDKCPVPFVVRRTAAANIVDGLVGYELLGEAYVHGLMQGEAMEMHDVELEDVMLV